MALLWIAWLASVVLGRRLIEGFERQSECLPLVQTIYGGTKRFLQSLGKPLVSGQRVAAAPGEDKSS